LTLQCQSDNLWISQIRKGQGKGSKTKQEREIKLKMNVLVYKPGEEPVEMEIDNTLEAMQKIVGGYIEVVRLPYLPTGERFLMVVNEEGMLMGLPQNRGQLVGNMFACAEDGEEFRGLTAVEVGMVKNLVDAFLPAPSIK
jgi:hypothetical protein